MLSHCLKCGKDIKNINSKVSKTSNGQINVSSKCEVYNDKKLNIDLSECQKEVDY